MARAVCGEQWIDIRLEQMEKRPGAGGAALRRLEDETLLRGGKEVHEIRLLRFFQIEDTLGISVHTKCIIKTETMMLKKKKTGRWSERFGAKP